MKTSTKTITLKRLNIRLSKRESESLKALLDCLALDCYGDYDQSIRDKITAAIGEFIAS